MNLSRILSRGGIAAVALGGLVELGSLAYARHQLTETLAAGASIPLMGSGRNLVYRSRAFSAGWLGGAGRGDLVLSTSSGLQRIAIPVILTTRQGIGLDGSVVRVAIKVQIPPVAQRDFARLNDPEPIAAELRIFPWSTTWAMRVDFHRAWGNIGMLQVNFAGATLRWRRRGSSIRSDMSVGRVELYRADRSSSGFAQDALHVESDEVVAKGQAHDILSLRSEGLRIGRYSIPLLSLQGDSDTIVPFDPASNDLLAPPTSSGSVVHVRSFRARVANQGELEANADLTIPPFEEGNLADMAEAVRKGFKLRTSIDFDQAFSRYFDNLGVKLGTGPWANPMASLFRRQDGHYLCDFSYEAGHAVINGREITVPNSELIPGVLVPRVLVPPPPMPVPMRPGNPGIPYVWQKQTPRMMVHPWLPPPAQGVIPLDRLPFRLGESISQVRIGLAAIGSKLPIPQGGVANIHLNQRGIWLFFAPNGTVRTIRLDWPFAGRIHGVGLGDTEARLLELMGSPVRPPWAFAGDFAYLYRGAHQMIRYDIGNGRVQTIFELPQPGIR
ncbi:MAG: hypothetical protein KGR99_00655 [Betaproteobacteria bacterium]|nr:hypothetical protein [Betaproteobacteria bacterium]MDE2150923.1 hypothetical protein [Betaproteobacteria bacterium]